MMNLELLSARNTFAKVVIAPSGPSLSGPSLSGSSKLLGSELLLRNKLLLDGRSKLLRSKLLLRNELLLGNKLLLLNGSSKLLGCDRSSVRPHNTKSKRAYFWLIVNIGFSLNLLVNVGLCCYILVDILHNLRGGSGGGNQANIDNELHGGGECGTVPIE